MLTSLGMEKQNAIRCVEAARTPSDANYSVNGPSYRKDMYTMNAGDVKERNAGMLLSTVEAPRKSTADDSVFRDEGKYQAYIDSHLHGSGPRNNEKLVSDLSKVIAAHYMKDLKKEYKTSTIDEMSKFIRKSYALDSLKPGELTSALGSENAARSKSLEMRDKLYRVPEDAAFTYSRSMAKVLKNMVDPKGHSEAYQKLYNNVK